MQHELFQRLHAVGVRVSDTAQGRALMDEAFAIVDRMPFERDDITGLEHLSSAFYNASAVAFRERDYDAAASFDVRNILIDAGLNARFPSAPRTFSNLDAAFSRQSDWRNVTEGMRRWRGIMDDVIAHIESQADAPGEDWRFPLVLARIWNCTAYRYASDFAAGERECDTALTQAEALQRELPQNAQAARGVAVAYIHRANLELYRGDTDAALTALSRSLSTMVTENGHYVRANVHATRGDWRSAITDIDVFNRIRPGNAAGLARSCRYRALLNEGLDTAERDCRESLRLSATRDARVNLALVHLRQGDHAAAMALYDQVLRTSANDAEALYGRGLARRRSGQASEGAADMAAGEAADAALIASLRELGFAAP
jgi:tetratricopeptide (TPR) repeat protein